LKRAQVAIKTCPPIALKKTKGEERDLKKKKGKSGRRLASAWEKNKKESGYSDNQEKGGDLQGRNKRSYRSKAL